MRRGGRNEERRGRSRNQSQTTRMTSSPFPARFCCCRKEAFLHVVCVSESAEKHEAAERNVESLRYSPSHRLQSLTHYLKQFDLIIVINKNKYIFKCVFELQMPLTKP